MLARAAAIGAVAVLCGCAAQTPADPAETAPTAVVDAAPGVVDPGDRTRAIYDAAIRAQVDASAAGAAAVAGPDPASVEFGKLIPAIPEGAVPDPVLAAGPQGAELWADLGVRLLRQDSHDSALRAFSRSMAREGVGLRNVLGASAAMRGLGRLNQAQRLLETAVRSWPESASLRNNLGVLLHARGHPEDAATELRVALALTSRNAAEASLAPVVERNLGMALTAIDMARAAAPPADPAPEWDVAVLGIGHYALVATERSE